MGTASFAVPSLRSLAEGPYRPVAVFTRPDRSAGRGRQPRPSPVKLASVDLGIPVFQPERVSKPPGLDELRSLLPELVVVAAFGEILNEQTLAVPSIGAINLHASLLPRYRGAAPIQRAILAGERVTGVSVQWMARQMDAGDIILQRQTEIGEEEDFGSLHDRLAALGAEAVVSALDMIRRGCRPRLPQDHSQATLAPPIAPADTMVDWDHSAEEIARQVRALSPRPGSRTTRSGELLKLLAARPGKNAATAGGIPGQVMESTDDGFLVRAGHGCLLVLRVQPAGRRAMSATDYLRGYRLRQGDRLGT